MKSFVFYIGLLTSLSSLASPVDCSEAYKKTEKCEHITCNEKQKTFLGTWSGPFQSYSQELSTQTKSVFRPFQNTVTYAANDCLRNIDNGDILIIGRRTDSYSSFQGLPSKTETGLLITGKHADGSPFLRTVDQNGVNDYQLQYQNSLAELAVWTLTIPAHDQAPEMRFTTIDGRDFNDVAHHKRNVVVTMSVGPSSLPIWEGIVSTGTHTLQ